MSNLFNPPKHAQGSLIGVDGNAFALIAYFSRQARRQGWSQDDIAKVAEAAMSDDYNNLIATLDAHLEGESDEHA